MYKIIISSRDVSVAVGEECLQSYSYFWPNFASGQLGRTTTAALQAFSHIRRFLLCRGVQSHASIRQKGKRR
jgi:hypothetical protein